MLRMHAHAFRFQVHAVRRNLQRCRPSSRAAPRRRLYKVRAAANVTPFTTDGLILPLGEEGAWDCGAVGSPVVRCYVGDNEQRWFMWYSGRSAPGNHTYLDAITAATGSIGVALSSDGVNWKRGKGPVTGARGAEGALDVGQILGPNTDSWWWLDTCHLSVSDVQVFSNSSVSGGVGVYWMMYSGGDFEQVQVPPSFVNSVITPSTSDAIDAPMEVKGIRMRPGLAMSQDGKNWARIEGEHHTGALFDVGEAGEWDELFVAAPKLLAAGPRDMRMYYTSFCKQRQRFLLGLALSPDGFRWKKNGLMFEGSTDPKAFDALGVASAHVVRDVDSRQFLMFYEGVAKDGTRAIGLAVSKDGKSNWQRFDKPVLEGAKVDNAWDLASVGAPCAVSMSGGRWRLYYSGRQTTAGPWQGIGVALSMPDAATFNGAPTTFKRRSGTAQG